jgi:hypothetical protein
MALYGKSVENKHGHCPPGGCGTSEIASNSINSSSARIKEKLNLPNAAEVFACAVHWVKEQGL